MSSANAGTQAAGAAQGRYLDPLGKLEAQLLKPSIVKFDVGDTVRVNIEVVEGDRTRKQGFEGVVISRRGAGISASFIVRKISFGVGVERLFQLHSPVISDIALVRKGRARRAKLYYLRELQGKKARRKTQAKRTS